VSKFRITNFDSSLIESFDIYRVNNAYYKGPCFGGRGGVFRDWGSVYYGRLLICSGFGIIGGGLLRLDWLFVYSNGFAVVFYNLNYECGGGA
jgi:hypothetical protein